MTNKEAVENYNIVIFKAEDANDPTWDYIISVLRENIPGFNAGHGYGKWIAFAVPKEEMIKAEMPELGQWFIDERPESNREVICSNCDQPIFKYHKLDFDYRPKYCPNCGKRMDVRGE